MRSLLLSVLLIGCAHQGPIPSPRCDPDAAIGSVTSSVVVVEAPVSLAPEAEEVRAWMDASARCLAERFPEAFDPGLVAAHRPAVRVYVKSNPKASEGWTLLETGTADGRIETYAARIHYLPQACFAREAQNRLGAPYDVRFAHETLTHELATVGLELKVRQRGPGFDLYDAPAWFYQGYAEYLALVCASGSSRPATLEAYLQAVRRDDRALADPHVGGAVRIAYLYDEHGAERMNALLQSRGRFGPAFEEALGFRTTTLENKIRAWLAR